MNVERVKVIIKQESVKADCWDRIEYDIYGNPYKLTITNGKEFESKSEPCKDVVSRANRGDNMGTIRNEMTVVHHWNKDELEKVREDAIEVFDQVTKQTGLSILHNEEIVSPIMTTLLNGEYTFIINGDCSKIG